MDVAAPEMENMGLKSIIAMSLLFTAGLSVGCANKVLNYDKAEQLQEHSEFDKAVKIEETAAPVTVPPTSASTPTPAPSPEPKNKKLKKAPAPTKKSKASAAPTRRQPELESDAGFQGRRPLKDPFRVGEQVVHSVRYFKMSAGELTLQVNPFVKVNGVTSYRFVTSIKTSSMFSSFYAVDDRVETLVDYETLVPSVFTLHVKETGQIKESRSYFDHTTMRAKFWEKKVTEKSGREERNLEWDLAPYAQNVFSAAFYMRNFAWDVGTENAFVVSDDEKNLVFKGKGIRRETLDTDAGVFKAIVIKPEITLKDKFQPIGDVFIWLSDDDRKYILRIESKIKIGTLVSEIIRLEPGQE